MTGFLPLFRKELLELRRTWRFLAMVGVLTLVAVLMPAIGRIVVAVRDEAANAEKARELLQWVGGGFIPGLGTFLAIIIAMGALAQERATGTAAMTLSKPVTRAAFVLAKFLAIAISIFASIAFAGLSLYVLILLLFEGTGAGRFALGMVLVATYLLFISSIALFWSAASSRQLLAGGVTFAAIIIQQILTAIPHTGRYFPVATAEYANNYIAARTTDQWPALAIASGCIVLLGLGAWALFQRKEL